MSVSPMFPLGAVLFPGERLPLHIFEPRYQQMAKDCLAQDEPSFGVVLIARGKESGGGDVRHDVATAAHIITQQPIGDGRLLLECIGADRLRVDAWLEDDPYPRADVRPWPDEADGDLTGPDFVALQDKISALYQLVGLLPDTDEPLDPPVFLDMPMSNGERLFSLAAQVPMGPSDRLDVLSAPGPTARLRALNEAVESATAVVQFRLL